MSITHTRSGLVNKYLFYSRTLVWVEGKEDINFFRPLAEKLNAEIKLKPAKGKEECSKLVEGLREDNYPYVVVMDGDYDILEGNDNYPSKVVVLQRYSHENYLFEKETLNLACKQLARCDEQIITDTQFESLLEELSYLRELVKVDLAHRLADTEHSVWPDNPQSILKSRDPILIAKDRIDEIVENYRDKVNEDKLIEAAKMIETYLEEKRICFIIKGHFILHISYDFIRNYVRKCDKSLGNFQKRSLRTILSRTIWESLESEDHIELKRQFSTAINLCES